MLSSQLCPFSITFSDADNNNIDQSDMATHWFMFSVLFWVFGSLKDMKFFVIFKY